MPRLEVPLFLPLPSSLLHTLASGGVSRFELCAGPYATGGLTPSASAIGSAISAIASGVAQAGGHDAVVHAMIRPRGGDFVYSASEIEAMRADIERFALLGVDGVVFGVLQRTDTGYGVNAKACSDLVREARRHGLKAVFHRAFDEAEDWTKALDLLRECQFDAVLTAGGKGSAKENIETLTKVAQRAKSLGIEPIIGGGLRSANLEQLRERLEDVQLWHSAAIVDGGEAPNVEEVERLIKIFDGADS